MRATPFDAARRGVGIPASGSLPQAARRRDSAKGGPSKGACGGGRQRHLGLRRLSLSRGCGKMRWRRYHITSKSGKNPVKRGGEESGERRPMTNANMASGQMRRQMARRSNTSSQARRPNLISYCAVWNGRPGHFGKFGLGRRWGSRSEPKRQSEDVMISGRGRDPAWTPPYHTDSPLGQMTWRRREGAPRFLPHLK